MEKKINTFNYFIFVLIILVVAFLGITYAYWNVTINQENKNVVKSVCLKVSLTKDENQINLPKAVPITDVEGQSLTPYEFSIQNICEENASYQINLESLSKISGTEEISEDDRLAPKYVRFKLNEKEKEGTMLLLSNTDVVKPILDNTYSSHKLMTGYLSPSETKEFELRLWIDEDADEGAISKTFASKVTITNAYLEEDKIPPTATLDLAVCDNLITVTGSGQANKDKTISKYEYKLDGDDWVETTSTEPKTFTVEEYGLHKVSLRVTDNTNNVSGEVIKEVEIKEPETVNIYGKNIPLVSCDPNGLYKVEHNEADVAEGWKKEEYRFAGVNYTNASTSYVHNYVNFNEEKWRIIGLVNVKTEDEKYEQRLKIVRTDGVGSQKDFGSYYWNNTSNNDWTTSSLKNMLNGIYYSSGSGDCYTDSKTATQCDFSQESTTLPKGLDGTAQGMVDDGVTWNLGGTADFQDSSNGLVTHWYNYERGTTVPSSHQTEWTKANDENNHKGVGLIYPSDYGYATNGGSKGREECFKKELSKWNKSGYKEECTNKDWLKPSSNSNNLWTITPNSGLSDRVFSVYSAGNVSYYIYSHVTRSDVVWPVVYLKSSIQISGGDGTFNTPYTLTLTDFEN